MRKLIAMLLVLAMLGALTACSSTETTPENSTPQDAATDTNEEQTPEAEPEEEDIQKKPQEEIKPDETETPEAEEPPIEAEEEEKQPEETKEKLGEFIKTAVMEETVMVDESDIKITATSLTYGYSSFDVELLIENNTEQALTFVSGSIGYCCNSINGYMVSDGYLNCEVAAGKKAKDTINFGYNELMLYGIQEIADIEIGFKVTNDDYDVFFQEPRQIKTSAYDTYDYSTDYYQTVITSPAAMNTFQYKLLHFSQEDSYNEGGIQLVSSCLIENKNEEIALMLEFESASDQTVQLVTSDIFMNGLALYSYNWSTDSINSGKKCILSIELSSVLEKEFWDIFGIQDVGSVALALKQQDGDGNKIIENIPIEITIDQDKSVYSPIGTEVYNNNGVRLVFKQILDDPSKYSSDVHALLLVENTSGKEIYFSGVSRSMSINGLMYDSYSIFSDKEIPNGRGAVIDIELWSYDLEDIDIAKAEDIEDLEFSISIKDANRNLMDEAVIAISLK